jgi:hypothetical protein
MDCEVWICIDAEGEYTVGKTADDSIENYGNDVGDLADVTQGHRLVKVTVYIPLPTVAIVQATAPPLPAVGVTAVV